MIIKGVEMIIEDSEGKKLSERRSEELILKDI